jgi:hypothetical protein
MDILDTRRSSREISFVLSELNQTWTFSAYFRNILRNQIWLKSVRCGVTLFDTEGQTDRQDEAKSL